MADRPLTLADLARLMAEAAARDDFEEAARLRNRLFVARQAGLGEADRAPDDTGAEIARQQPGAMGIGSQHPRPSKPEGWKPPRKPPPMTKNTGGGRPMLRPAIFSARPGRV